MWFTPMCFDTGGGRGRQTSGGMPPASCVASHLPVSVLTKSTLSAAPLSLPLMVTARPVLSRKLSIARAHRTSAGRSLATPFSHNHAPLRARVPLARTSHPGFSARSTRASLRLQSFTPVVQHAAAAGAPGSRARLWTKHSDATPVQPPAARWPTYAELPTALNYNEGVRLSRAH